MLPRMRIVVMVGGGESAGWLRGWEGLVGS